MRSAIRKHSGDRTLLEKLRDALHELVQKLTGKAKKQAQTAEGMLQEAFEAASHQAAENSKNAANLTGNRYNDTILDNKYSMKGDTDNEREGAYGVRSAAQEEAENRGGTDSIQGTAAEVLRRNAILRRERGVTPDFGEKPTRIWAAGNIVKPADGSAAYLEQQTAMEYGIPSFVVSDEVWDANHKGSPAFSVGGQIYFRENIPEKNRGMLAPHEITHVMKQTGYKPYLDFVAKTPEMLDTNKIEAAVLLERAAKHRGIDMFGKDGYLDSEKLSALDEKNKITLFDELNATLYGHIGSGRIVGLRPYLDAAFRDFSAYSSELRSIHEQFKQDRSSGGEDRIRTKKYSLKTDTLDPKRCKLNRSTRILSKPRRSRSLAAGGCGHPPLRAS